MKQLRSTEKFTVKASSPAKSVEIEGVANAAVVDRMNEQIPGKAWKLDQYKKNNILLFNHDHNMPIGTAEVRATDEGLVAKAKISRSNEAPIPYIRDMIKEGILKTFSVGFDPMGSMKMADDQSHAIIEEANLLELSVVSVPANQESTFAVSKKLGELAATWKQKTYAEVKADVLGLKGASLAKKLAELVGDENKEVFLEELEKAGFPRPQIHEVLAGDQKAVSDSLLSAIATALGIDEEQIKSSDPEDEEKPKSEDQDKDEEKTGSEQDEDDKEKAAEDVAINLDETSAAAENAQTSNPSMDQFKAQTTLLAQNNAVLEKILGAISALNTNIMMLAEGSVSEPEEEEKAPESDESQETQGEEEKAALDASADRMSKYLGKLASIEEFLRK